MDTQQELTREHWQNKNDRYLAAMLAWLHWKLRRMAGGNPAVQAVLAPAQENQRGWWPFGRDDEPAPQPSLPMPSVELIDAQVAQAASAVQAAVDDDDLPVLLHIRHQFQLSEFEQDTLFLCAAMELDTRTAALCAQAQGDPARPYPTFALALALFEDPAWEALNPGGPLRYWQLIEINQPGAQPLTTSPLRADERIVNAIKGLNYVDDRLTPLLVPLDRGKPLEPLSASQQQVVQALLQKLEAARTTGSPPVIQLTGPDTASKQAICRASAAALGANIFRLPAGMFPNQPADVEMLARLWLRERMLLPLILYLEAGEEGESGQQQSLQRFLLRSSGIFFIDTRETRLDLGPVAAVVDAAKPLPAEQRAAWAGLLGADGGPWPELLAEQFNFNLETITNLYQQARSRAAAEGRPLLDLLWEACRDTTRPQLGALAQRIDAKATWDDIVLPAVQERLLRQMVGQVSHRSMVYEQWGFRDKMNRGLGISALFAGESGTGKTMAAEVIANDLRLNLYRIDLSSVVSKYIGETEKNLRRLFDAAEDGGSILFFDEADALFGKRSEVKDSHDRYANIEINYLLQRMEAYRGLAILATNLKSSLDPAFLRRLRFIVNFPFPSVEDRKKIWMRVFPPRTPVHGLDYDRLARLSLTGGSIHNIALNAAFLAAKERTNPGMAQILSAAREELRKLERPVNEADFLWKEPLQPERRDTAAYVDPSYL